MNSETFDPNNVENHDQQRKRKALDPLTDIVNHAHLQYASEIGNIEQQQQQQCASPLNYINNVQCQCGCGCHMVATDDAMDALYLDRLPVGYRFVPTDKELIRHYLLRKIMNKNLPKNKISEATVYDKHPNNFVGNYPQAKEGEWYFFTSRLKKYPKGKRPNRSAGPGYWKATGPDKVIRHNGVKIGGKKSLVYYEGKSQKGTKSNWMMHEYVVEGYEREWLGPKDMKLDDYVLCKIYNKHERGKEIKEEVSDQKPHVASNDLDRNLTTNLQVENGVIEANQEAQDMNPAKSQIENNAIVQQSNQNSNYDIHQAEHNLPILNSIQHMNPSVDNRVKEIKRQIMVPDQQTHLVSYQDANPTNFLVENNMVIQHSNHNSNHAIHHVENNFTMLDSNQDMNPSVENVVKEVKRMVHDQHAHIASNQVQYPNQNSIHVTHHVENNLPTMDYNQQMINPSVKKEVEQVQRQVTIPDQQPRLIFHHNINPTINLQVNNNMLMQKLSNIYNPDMGSPYGRVPINMSPPRSPHFPQLVNHTFTTRFNQHKQLLPNRSPHFPPQWSPHPHLSQNMHVNPEMYHLSSPPALQEGNDCEEQDVTTCIENMSTKDGNYILLNPDFICDVDDQIIDLGFMTKP